MDILKMTVMLSIAILMDLAGIIYAQELTVTGTFRENPPILRDSLQLNCAQDGDKIKIVDVIYKTTGCRNSESRPQDPAAESNQENIYQCTGKRTCVVPADHMRRPFLPKKPPNCVVSTQYQISIMYMCVPQDEIKSMCSSFSSQEFVGYLSTPSYPMLLKPGEPPAPCRCHLEATRNSRIRFTLLESNLVGNTSGTDMNACQTEKSKQYLEIAYNHGMAQTYMLCSHKYNVEMQSSTVYTLMFENPIGREAGAIWMQYSAEEQGAMVKVSCDEPIVTTIAPIFYTNLISDHGNGQVVFTSEFDYRLLLGVVAASLFLLIIIAIIIITVKYKRRNPMYRLIGVLNSW